MKTIDLIENALEINPSPKYWCDQLRIKRTALNVAKVRGHLSPVVAGALAMKLGLNPQKWVIVAALETAPESSTKTKLLSGVTSL